MGVSCDHTLRRSSASQGHLSGRFLAEAVAAGRRRRLRPVAKALFVGQCRHRRLQCPVHKASPTWCRVAVSGPICGRSAHCDFLNTSVIEVFSAMSRWARRTVCALGQRPSEGSACGSCGEWVDRGCQRNRRVAARRGLTGKYLGRSSPGQRTNSQHLEAPPTGLGDRRAFFPRLTRQYRARVGPGDWVGTIGPGRLGHGTIRLRARQAPEIGDASCRWL